MGGMLQNNSGGLCTCGARPVHLVAIYVRPVPPMSASVLCPSIEQNRTKQVKILMDKFYYAKPTYYFSSTTPLTNPTLLNLH